MRKGSFSLRLDDFDSEEPLEDQAVTKFAHVGHFDIELVQIMVNFELLKQWFELMGRETPWDMRSRPAHEAFASCTINFFASGSDLRKE